MDRTVLTPQGVEVRGETLRIVFMYKGTRCRETLKLAPTKTNIKYCTNLRAEILNKIARNDFNYNEYFPESKLAKRLEIIQEIKVYYCQELLEQQLAQYARMVKKGYMSSSTSDVYRKVIKGQLIPNFGKYNINDITAPIIREWISNLEATPKTIRNYLIALGDLFANAIIDGLLKDNPIEQIALSKLIQVASVKSDFNTEPFNEIEK
jgi:integrase